MATLTDQVKVEFAEGGQEPVRVPDGLAGPIGVVQFESMACGRGGRHRDLEQAARIDPSHRFDLAIGDEGHLARRGVNGADHDPFAAWMHAEHAVGVGV